ncbi:MAG: hypothetical protein LBG72_00350 [Spirochaetaceae bacterium]|jgi:hypothetical protein|nr:hypothetical protein [Spirochaetaceae bacterium]
MRRVFFVLSFFTALCYASAQGILRGEVRIDIEPVYALGIGQTSPLTEREMEAWALEETALCYAGMIYGWEFVYEPGETARNISENISLTPLGKIQFGDTRLKVDAAKKIDGYFSLWTDYRLNESQNLRVSNWNRASSGEMQSSGFGALTGKTGEMERGHLKDGALEDAARKAVRARLRGIIPNRPRRVRGRIALAAFPIYGINAGLRTVNARFRFTTEEIEPYMAW